VCHIRHVFDHVTIRAADRDASERFYATVLPVLGIARDHSDEHVARWGDFRIAASTNQHPPTRRLHIGFVAPSHAHVDEFWRAGTDAGYRDGAYVLDPDGNAVGGVALAAFSAVRSG
jgi:catechol 2,3-dioxygenase-like lactoylglutathione lyase family enzyme